MDNALRERTRSYRSPRKRLLVGGATVAALGLFLVLFGAKVYEKYATARRNLEGYSLFLKVFEERPPAPAFALKDLKGREVSSESFRGKVVFLSFRTTW